MAAVALLRSLSASLAQAAAPAPDPTPLVPGWDAVGWIDLAGLGAVAVLAVLGIVRGLWWQVARLVGLLAAVLVARSLSPRWVPALQRAFPELDARLAHGIVWVLVFLAALGLAAFLGRLGRTMLEAMQLGWVDRMGGAVAGAVTGVLVHLAFLVGLAYLGPTAWVSRQLTGSYSETLLDALGRRWPVALAAEQSEELRWLLGDPPERSAPQRSTPGGADGSADLGGAAQPGAEGVERQVWETEPDAEGSWDTGEPGDPESRVPPDAPPPSGDPTAGAPPS